METNKLIISLLILMVLYSCSYTAKSSSPKASSIEDTEEYTGKQEQRVCIDYLGNGVSILTVDSHEYVHYRDDVNAASTGGIVHKVDCKKCCCDTLK